MKKLLYVKDSEEFWQIFSIERDKRRKRLTKLPFAKKVAILEMMQADIALLRNSALATISRETIAHRIAASQEDTPKVRIARRKS